MTTLFCQISVGYHLELHTAITLTEVSSLNPKSNPVTYYKSLHM